MKHYYYLHVNGDLIHKPAMVVESDPDYFDSDMVKRVWQVETEDRDDAWRILIEALVSGARVDRVRDLAEQWGCDEDDLPHFLVNNMSPTEEQRKGLDLFIREIFQAEPNEFWEEFLKKNAGVTT